MVISPNQIVPFAEKHVAGFRATGDPVLLSGGNLNFIWRVPGTPHNVIVKHAPPYIAGQPDIPLDPQRIHFEAKALQQFSDDGKLHPLKSGHISPPALYHFDEEHHLLMMEDVGINGGFFSGELGADHVELSASLGEFIGNLHQETAGNLWFKKNFNNSGIQQTRQQVQYNGAEEFLVNAGIKPEQKAVDHARTLGQKLLTPGKCMVMGDLWPPSVIIQQHRLRIIDWEFAHFGYPFQDTAHFLAHCTLHRAAAGSKTREKWVEAIARMFLKRYQSTLGEETGLQMDRKEQHDFNIHYAMELLIRTTGAFRSGYLFEDIPVSDPVIQQIVHRAYSFLLNPDRHPDWP